ncbi:Ger(x)C family spore germination protein [Paenibacillus andongensis]|uniref:Ger(x)C family spore germination protein n=1 Tax=Paenibacillus andongensis TaxID=2975482 RepID=UPI0021BAEA7D|nr:Ger(x)C family spore germination protein [Paenibacillus andongensis]
MKKAWKLYFALLLTILCLTGCWDFQEPNQLAFITGVALDLTNDGQFEISSQIAIPSVIGGQDSGGGGENKKSFRVVSAAGKNIMDAGQNLQTQISRALFYGHRQTILIGQRMAEHGVGNFLDMFIRNPQSELRSTIYVVKDGLGKDLLSLEPIFDPYTATALVNEQASLGLKPYFYRKFLSDALSQGIHPLLPAVSSTSLKKYTYAGTAVFNKDDGMKLVGFLDTKKSYYANWILDRLNGFTVTAFVPEGNGIVSLQLQSLDRQIRSKKVKDQIQIEVRLTGKGLLVENSSNLDPTKRKDLRIIQDKLSQTTQKSIQQLIEKVQKQYNTDIFGFGQSVHEQHPHKWKALKQEWNKIFAELSVSVEVDLQCKDPGQTTTSFMGIP